MCDEKTVIQWSSLDGSIVGGFLIIIYTTKLIPISIIRPDVDACHSPEWHRSCGAEPIPAPRHGHRLICSYTGLPRRKLGIRTPGFSLQRNVTHL